MRMQRREALRCAEGIHKPKVIWLVEQIGQQTDAVGKPSKGHSILHNA